MSSVIPRSVGGQLRLARTHLETELRTGKDCRAERLLAEFPAVAADPESALELVYTEFVLRQELGQKPTPEEWYTRFPAWKTDLEQMFQIHDALVTADASLPGAPTRGNGAARRSRWLTSIPGYNLEEELGRGGMGVVYKATQTALNRVVALKVILSGAHAGTKELDRFRREAEAAARLDHPNIVRIYEVGEADGRPYCAMEYVGGGTLAAHLTGAPWEPEQAASFVALLARAVQHAHDRGIVHRDLKPANILLAVAGGQQAAGSHDEGKQQFSSLPTARCPLPTTPKVADFGLAKLLSDSDPGPTLSGDILGTPAYMAPEQAEGRAAGTGPHTDVWALGVLLYELLTGKQPFQGDSHAEILHRVKTTEPAPPRQLCPRLPRDLQTVCLKCLTKLASGRYLSAAMLAEDLERWLRGDSIVARPVGVAGRMRRWCERNPKVAVLLACLAGVTVAGVVGVLWQWREATERRDEALVAERQARTARETAEDRLYASLIAQAALELTTGRTASAEAILDACRETDPGLRNWEWHYLRRQCQRHSLTLAGHTQPVNSIAYSPDGSLVVSGTGHFNSDTPGEVFLWDAVTGRRRAELRGPTATVNSVAFHPSGEWVAAGSKDGHVYRWSVRDPDRPPVVYPFAFGVNSIAFHPDGATVAIASGRSVTVWNLNTPQPTSIVRTNTDAVFDVAFSPDGRYLASACRDGSVTVRATDDYRVVCERFHRSDAKRVAFSPDARLLASTSYDGTVAQWAVADGFQRVESHQIGYSNGLDLGFRPDGMHYGVTTQSEGVHVWHQKGQRKDAAVVPSSGRHSGLAFSPDGRWVATAQEDHAIRIWDVTPQPNPKTITTQGAWSAAVATSPDGSLLAIAGGYNRTHRLGERTVRVFEYPSLRMRSELRGHPGWLTAVAFRSDGAQIASADESGATCLWNPATGERQQTLGGHAGEVHALAYRPGRADLATAGADGAVRVWNADTGDEFAKLVHPDRVQAVAYSPDGRTLATGCADRLIRLWDADTHKLIRTLAGHTSPVNSLAFQPGSTSLASADEGQQLLFWDAVTGSLFSPPGGPGREPSDEAPVRGVEKCRTALAFSPDGRRLAFAKTPQLLQVWDPQSRRPLLSFTASDYAEVPCAAFTADGQQLLVTNRNVLRVYDSAAVDGRERVRAAQEPAARAAWHTDRMNACTNLREWWAAEFHATRAIAAGPTVRMYSVRSMSRAARGNFDGAAADHHAALALAGQSTWYGRFALPGPGPLWTVAGEGFAYRGQWDRAERVYAVALALQPESSIHWNNLSSLHLAQGRDDLFRALRRAMLDRLGNTKSPRLAMELVNISVCAPLPERAEQVLELAARAAEAVPGGVRARAAAHYRAGRFTESLQDSLAAERVGRPGKADLVFRAMALHQLGRGEEARAWLGRVRALAAEADRLEASPTALGDSRWQHWNEQVEVKALLREAGAIIDAK